MLGDIPMTGGVRDLERAQQNFNAIKQDMMARFGDWRQAEAYGFTVQEDVRFYHSRDEGYAHAHGPKIDGKQIELMYEITPDGQPGRLVGIMMPVEGDLGAGKAHGHEKDGTGMQQHVWFLRKDGGEWKGGPGAWREMDPSDPAQLDRAFDGDRPDWAH